MNLIRKDAGLLATGATDTQLFVRWGNELELNVTLSGFPSSFNWTLTRDIDLDIESNAELMGGLIM